jgi:hypothetical protein
LQAFMDESVDDDGTFVIAGHIADVQAWAAFSAEWERMLPSGALDKDDNFHFKMSQMAQSPERMSRVPGFYRIIEKHALHSISCRINERELARAIDRVHVPNTNINWGNWRSPYVAGFRALMDHFHYKRDGIARAADGLPADATIDFYFDERSDKGKIRDMWDEYLANREPRIRDRFGNEPRFENDKKFLPLQAADLWAWWVRKWSADGNPVDKLLSLDFGSWQGKGLPRTHISMTEDQWVETFASFVAPQVPKFTAITDKKTGRVIGLGARA